MDRTVGGVMLLSPVVPGSPWHVPIDNEIHK